MSEQKFTVHTGPLPPPPYVEVCPWCHVPHQVMQAPPPPYLQIPKAIRLTKGLFSFFGPEVSAPAESLLDALVFHWMNATGASERPPITPTGHITSGLAPTDNLTYKELYEVSKRLEAQALRGQEDLMSQLDALRKEKPAAELANRLRAELRELNKEYCDALDMMTEAIRERNDLRVRVAMLEAK